MNAKQTGANNNKFDDTSPQMQSMNKSPFEKMVLPGVIHNDLNSSQDFFKKENL